MLRKNTDSCESAHNLRIACGKISITVNTINASDCFEMQMFCFIAGVVVSDVVEYESVFDTDAMPRNDVMTPFHICLWH